MQVQDGLTDEHALEAQAVNRRRAELAQGLLMRVRVVADVLRKPIAGVLPVRLAHPSVARHFRQNRRRRRLR